MCIKYVPWPWSMSLTSSFASLSTRQGHRVPGSPACYSVRCLQAGQASFIHAFAQNRKPLFFPYVDLHDAVQ